MDNLKQCDLIHLNTGLHPDQIGYFIDVCRVTRKPALTGHNRLGLAFPPTLTPLEAVKNRAAERTPKRKTLKYTETDINSCGKYIPKRASKSSVRPLFPQREEEKNQTKKTTGNAVVQAFNPP